MDMLSPSCSGRPSILPIALSCHADPRLHVGRHVCVWGGGGSLSAIMHPEETPTMPWHASHFDIDLLCLVPWSPCPGT